MKDITNVAKINEFFAQNGQIEYPKWIELAKEHFSESFKKECQHLIDTFESAAAKKDRHAYAFAYGNYRVWIEAARTSIMNCMKRDCNNMSKHFGIELDARLGRGIKKDWYSLYVEDVVNPVLSVDGMFRKTIDTYNRLILPMAGQWQGFSVYTDSDGNRVVETDILVARLALRATEVIINQVTYTGGKQVFPAAGMVVSAVESIEDTP